MSAALHTCKRERLRRRASPKQAIPKHSASWVGRKNLDEAPADVPDALSLPPSAGHDYDKHSFDLRLSSAENVGYYHETYQAGQAVTIAIITIRIAILNKMRYQARIRPLTWTLSY